MRYIRKRYLKKKEAINKSKKFLIKVHKRCLKRNFDKFLSQSKNAPKKEKNKLKVIERKFLPTLDKYFKRINLWKWRDIAS